MLLKLQDAIAGAVGAGAEVYDAITGGGAEADRELVRGSVADVAPLTDLQREGITISSYCC